MKKISIITYYLIMILLSAGCIHQYPDMEIDDTTPVNVTVNVEIDSNLSIFQSVSRSSSLPQGQKRRFIIDVFQNGKPITEKRVLTAEAEEVEEGKFLIPISLQLKAQQYTFVVWSDYIPTEEEEKDAHFIAENLTNVYLHEHYCSDCEHRAAFCGTMEADFTPYKDGESVHVQQHITLKRPQAKFRIVSTDRDEFITRVKTRGDTPQDSYQAKISYEYFFPTAYNITGDVLCDSKTGINFIAPCTLETNEDGECELISDYVFAGKDASYVSLTLEIMDGTGKVISRATGVQVPLKQGQLTTVTGKFLTTMMRPGINIDNSYEGEFNITIP